MEITQVTFNLPFSSDVYFFDKDYLTSIKEIMKRYFDEELTEKQIEQVIRAMLMERGKDD